MNFLYFRSFYLTLFGNVAHFCLLSINFQLFCQISADNFRKVRNITDVSKILTKYLFFRCEIFFLSCEYPQNTDIKITQTPHFCCCIRDCSLSLIRLRIFCIRSVYDHIIWTSITQNDHNLLFFFSLKEIISGSPYGQSVTIVRRRNIIKDVIIL